MKAHCNEIPRHPLKFWHSCHTAADASQKQAYSMIPALRRRFVSLEETIHTFFSSRVKLWRHCLIHRALTTSEVLRLKCFITALTFGDVPVGGSTHQPPFTAHYHCIAPN